MQQLSTAKKQTWTTALSSEKWSAQLWVLGKQVTSHSCGRNTETWDRVAEQITEKSQPAKLCLGQNLHRKTCTSM